MAQVTGIARSIVMSDLLKASMARTADLNHSAALAPDRDACLEFRKAVSPPTQLPIGPPHLEAMVDGFPRTSEQVRTAQ